MQRVTPKNAPQFFASKWLHIQFLIDPEEMQDLFQALGEVFIFSTMGIKPQGENLIPTALFLEQYRRYTDLLKAQESIDDDLFRFYFSAVITREQDALLAIDVGNNREIIRPLKPILQVKLHRFDYSYLDGKIRPSVFGKDTIAWGIEISYPQLYQDPLTRICVKATDPALFPNAELFKQVQHWIRANTVPTPFLAQNVRIRCPIRIGKKCFEWIDSHKELKARKLAVFRQSKDQEETDEH